MVDEHTRESLLDITNRSITGHDLVAALIDIIAVRGTPVLIRCDKEPLAYAVFRVFLAFV